MDGPRLIHGNQRVTTDATLRRDLEDSLAATESDAPIHNREIRAALKVLQVQMDVIADHVERLLTTQALLASNQSDLGHMIEDVGRGVVHVVTFVNAFVQSAARDGAPQTPETTGHASARTSDCRSDRPFTHGPVDPRAS